uniref:Uncharacterized protein n=1 Tax=Trichuris muris TaxID=70415 RepID=A0A5S6QQ24_TRIMR
MDYSVQKRDRQRRLSQTGEQTEEAMQLVSLFLKRSLQNEGDCRSLVCTQSHQRIMEGGVFLPRTSAQAPVPMQHISRSALR